MITTERYKRQILLKEFGQEGQKKLLDSKVLCIGAGGLGCPALQYLAAAGVGIIGIVDFDLIDISNLHRQILYTVDDIGKSKAETASRKLKTFNSGIHVDSFNFPITNSNALEIISDYDLVIDGSDNFTTRYLVNDACSLLNKPLIYGAVSRFEGQVGVFNFIDKVSGVKTNYRDLFPKPPDIGSSLSCNEVGVLGVLPGIIGIMQASEAIKIITGIGDVLCNQIVTYNILSNESYKFLISQNEAGSSLVPKSETAFLNFDYDWFCGVLPSTNVISVDEFDDLLSKVKIKIIDVREKNEIPAVTEFAYTQIPMSQFGQEIASFETSGTIIVFCQTGKRSAKAVALMKEKNIGCKAYSLRGGIVEWKSHHETK